MNHCSKCNNDLYSTSGYCEFHHKMYMSQYREKNREKILREKREYMHSKRNGSDYVQLKNAQHGQCFSCERKKSLSIHRLGNGKSVLLCPKCLPVIEKLSHTQNVG